MPTIPASRFAWAPPTLAVAVALSLPLVGLGADTPVPRAPTPAPAFLDDQPAIGELMQGIDGLRRLPVQGVSIVQSGDKTFFVSANGRYVFLGPAIDLWHGERIDSLADADRLMGRIDISRLKLDLSELGALDVGGGSQDVLVFVDPACPQCATLLEQIAGLSPTQRAPYRFRLIPLALLGAPSLAAAVNLNCLAETNRPAATQALLTHRLAALPPAQERCGQGALQRALVTAHLLGVTSVPFLIAPDGRLQTGVPTDLLAWLAGGQA